MSNTTPTTTTFSLNAGQFITQAYRKLGWVDPNKGPTDDQINQGIVNFNLLLKGLQSKGINLWRQTRLTVSVGPGQGAPNNPVSITPLILGVESAQWVVTPTPNFTQRPMGIYAYGQYWDLPNPYQKSMAPTIFMFDRQENASNIYLWPVPVQGGTVNLTVARSILDVTQPSDTIDVPVEWQEAVLYNLCDRLMEDEAGAMTDAATAQRITERAVKFMQDMLDFDRPQSVYIKPYNQRGVGPYRYSR